MLRYYQSHERIVRSTPPLPALSRAKRDEIDKIDKRSVTPLERTRASATKFTLKVMQVAATTNARRGIFLPSIDMPTCAFCTKRTISPHLSIVLVKSSVLFRIASRTHRVVTVTCAGRREHCGKLISAEIAILAAACASKRGTYPVDSPGSLDFLFMAHPAGSPNSFICHRYIALPLSFALSFPRCMRRCQRA